MNNMVFACLEGVTEDHKTLIVAVHATRPPSDGEWAPYFAEISRRDPASIRNLVFTDGGAPNGAQRKQINDMLDGRVSRGAVVTTSTLVRGVVTALSWFNSELKIFAPKDLDAALRFLGVADSEAPRIRSEIGVLRKRLELGSLKATGSDAS